MKTQLITKCNYKLPSGLLLTLLGTKNEQSFPLNSLLNVSLQVFRLGKIADKSSTGILLAAK